MAQDEKAAEHSDGDEPERPDRDRHGLLAERPWYRHPFVILTAAGAMLFLLNWYMAATRTAGVPIFGS